MDQPRSVVVVFEDGEELIVEPPPSAFDRAAEIIVGAIDTGFMLLAVAIIGWLAFG
jgi:hypothetical protein